MKIMKMTKTLKAIFRPPIIGVGIGLFGWGLYYAYRYLKWPFDTLVGENGEITGTHHFSGIEAMFNIIICSVVPVVVCLVMYKGIKKYYLSIKKAYEKDKDAFFSSGQTEQEQGQLSIPKTTGGELSENYENHHEIFITKENEKYR